MRISAEISGGIKAGITGIPVGVSREIIRGVQVKISGEFPKRLL